MKGLSVFFFFITFVLNKLLTLERGGEGVGVICEHLDARTIIKTILLKKVIKSKIEGERDCLSFFFVNNIQP